jgi:hypothetical protein
VGVCQFTYDTQSMGVTEDFESMEQAIQENLGDMFDCWFNYAVIEKQTIGPANGCMGGSPAKQVQWYKFVCETTYDEGVIERCDEPDWAKELHITNWFFCS